MSETADHSPPSLPDEVAAFGTPDEVFPPGVGQRPPGAHIAITVAVVILGLVLWTAAALMAGILVIPGKPQPPRDVALYLGIPCMVFGSLALIYAAWLGLSGANGLHGGVCAQTYLLFKDVLVELFPDRHRVIAWADLGTVQMLGGVVKDYRYPVRDGKPLHFDYTMHDHERLAQAINRRQLLAALGGEAALATLTSGTAAPYFVACVYSLTSKNYRVSRLGKHLLFVCVGDGDTEEPKQPKNPVGAHLGAIGAGITAYGHYTRVRGYQQFLKYMERLEGADEPTLLQAAAEFPGSFLVSADDLHEMRIDPPSLWLRLNGRGVGQLKLLHARDGKQTYLLLAPQDLATATRALAALRPEMAGAV